VARRGTTLQPRRIRSTLFRPAAAGRLSGGKQHSGRGRLKNGNPSGDYAKAPRCGARNRRGTACQCSAMKNGRCRLHGGLSTGPKTPEGIERIRKARTKHGRYSQFAIVDEEGGFVLRGRFHRWAGSFGSQQTREAPDFQSIRLPSAHRDG
jgi:hypothetical protein